MESNYNPKKMIVSAAGKVNHDDFVEQISKTCSNLPKGTSYNRIAANYLGGEYREEKDLEQIHFIASFEGTDLHHEDYYSLLVYNSLLGEGMSSKLFQEIRRREVWCILFPHLLFHFLILAYLEFTLAQVKNKLKNLFLSCAMN